MGDWLEHVGLPQYESKLLLNGFDDLRYMVSDWPLFSVSFIALTPAFPTNLNKVNGAEF